MSHGKQLDLLKLQININGKRPPDSDSVKYVGTRIDKNTSLRENKKALRPFYHNFFERQKMNVRHPEGVLHSFFVKYFFMLKWN